MTARTNRYRAAILAAFGLLVLLLAVLVTNLLAQLRDISNAAGDNTQWSIAQLDTEFANLNAALTDHLAGQGGAPGDIQLRIDIALSRLNIINSGRAAEIFGPSAEAAELIAPLNTFAQRVIAIVDAPGDLTQADLARIREGVRAVRPNVRAIALLGVRLGAEQSQARRAQFSRQLSWTAGTAISLLVLMAGLLLVLDRLLRRAERRDAALATSSRRLASTVAASLDAIVTADDDGRIIGFNAAAERVFGWARADIIGQTMEETIIPHRMRDAHHNGMKRYLETGTPRVVDAGRVELAALRKSGEEFPVELNITTAIDADRTSFIAYIRDISERKINEQKLIDARDRAERTDQAKSQFLTVMSHEMRTPLNGILGVLDLLSTTPLSPQQQRYARIATSSSEILLEQINEALDITRIEAGALQLNPQDFSLPDLVAHVVEVLEPLAREKGLYLTASIDPAMQRGFHGDAGRVRQILTNLIGNAVKFTETGGITLHVSGIHGPDASSLRFEVTDTGPGIPPSQQEQVFEDFFAMATGEGRQTRGDGLGLAISRRIARAMGGDVSLASATGAGSTFTLTLSMPRTDTAPTPAADPNQPPRTTRSCTVLIVEDNSINRSVLGDMLFMMGHKVHEAVHGADGLEQAAQTPFDVIFMDISMPVMDGIAATRRLRAGDGPNTGTHVVGLTAHGREEFREEAEAAGMNRFHTKPIRMDALHSIIAEVTAGHRPPLDAAQFPDALRELLDALGPAKVRDIADRFLAELSAFTATLRDTATDPDTAAMAEAAHKAKGAASLLGQAEIATALARLEADARANHLDAAADWATRLDAQAAQARAAFDAALGRSSV
ncbi:MAG: ATP-binding protein [Pseudomonadota bacterium]